MNHGETQANWPVLIVGDYLFEPTIGLISGPGGAHRVCARTSALLLYLTERHEQLVERSDLIRVLWHDARGAGKALNRSIARIRKYFGDSAEAARYIETVPGRGYRLVAAVYGNDVTTTITATTTVPPRPARERHGRLRTFLLELRDRKVCRALLLYTIVVWLMAQVAEIVEPALRLPEWFTSFTVVVGILGFPIAAVLAWVFDITPDGLVFDIPRASGDREAPSRSRSEMLIDAALITCATALTAQLLISTFADETTASAGPDRQAVPGVVAEADRHVIAISPAAGSGEGFRAQAMSLQMIDRLTGSLPDHGGLIVVSRAVFDPSRRAGDAPRDVDGTREGLVQADDSHIRVGSDREDADADVYLFNEACSPQSPGPAGRRTVGEQTTPGNPRVPTRPAGFTRSSDAPSILAANL